MAVLLALCALLLTLCAQLPQTYRVDIGLEDGLGSDLPLIADFNTAERDANGTFRWTAGASRLHLPGLGQRPIELTIQTFPINDEMALRGPQSFRILAGGRDLGGSQVRPRGGIYHLLIPAPPEPWADQQISIDSATLVPSGDQRTLGVNIAAITIQSAGGPVLPPLRSTLFWCGALAIAWATLRRIGYHPDAAQRMLLFIGPPLGLAAVLDPPRLAFGAQPMLIALGLALPLAIILSRTGRWLSAQARSDLPPAAWRALCLLAVGTFVLRYGGKIYPDSMPGDIGFHINRFADALRGTIFILSKNRGVDFPYPPALYLIIAPLFLLVERGVALQISAALFDALSPLLIYLIAMRSQLIRDWRFAVTAAGLYALCGAGFMPTWWNFSTHIFAQFTHLLLITSVVLIWPRLGVRRQASGVRLVLFAGLILLQSLVYLGHFGFWVNTSLLGGLGLLALALTAMRQQAGWRRLLLLVVAFGCAQLLALLFFYTGYTNLLIDQIGRAATGGLNELAGRAPVSSAILWRTLRDGLYAHIGLLPIPLAISGLLLGRGQTHARALMAGTLLLGLAFAILPFLSGSTLATRWLMFSIWAIAIGSAAYAERLWRSGQAGRLFTLIVGGYVLWISAAMWIGALAWRIRPPEPF